MMMIEMMMSDEENYIRLKDCTSENIQSS